MSRARAGSIYDRIAGAYELIADAAEHRAKETGLDLLATAPGCRTLEIGTGTGRALERLAGESGPEGLVWGLDLSGGMLNIAGPRVRELRRVGLVRADARALPFAEASFDAAFMSFTLELFEDSDIRVVLMEARRVLRPGGRLGVVALDEEPDRARAYIWLHRHFPHFIDCRPIPVRDWLGTYGFDVDRSESISLWGLTVKAVVASRRATAPWMQPSAAPTTGAR